jgi:type I restriction enzyme, S subunit
MNVATFFEKFERFAEAADAVDKMRDLVLELAVQGRLVEQNKDDEPATAQLERVASKKSARGRVARAYSSEGKLTEQPDVKTLLPRGWAKAKLADVVTVLNGRAYAKDELLSSGTPVLRVGNLFTSKHWYYSNLELEPDKYCDSGDLISLGRPRSGHLSGRVPKRSITTIFGNSNFIAKLICVRAICIGFFRIERKKSNVLVMACLCSI